MDNVKKKRKFRFRFPNAFVVIGVIMLLFIAFSWIGEAAHITYADGTIKGLGLFDIFPAVWRGFTGKAEIILFIFALGGLLAVMGKSRIIDAGIASLVKAMNGKEIILIPALMLVFGLGGTTYGMWEETLAFLPIIIPVFLKAKYGGLTGVFVVLLGAGVGVLSSTINPFAVGVAVSSANENGLSEMMGNNLGWRWIIWFIFMIPAISFVMWYALRSKRTNLAKSYLTIENHKRIGKKFIQIDVVPMFSMRKKISLALFIFAFVLMIFFYLPWGTFLSSDALTSFNDSYNKYMFWLGSTNSAWAALGDWYFISVAGLFLFVTLVVFFINIRDYMPKKIKEMVEETIVEEPEIDEWEAKDANNESTSNNLYPLIATIKGKFKELVSKDYTRMLVKTSVKEHEEEIEIPESKDDQFVNTYFEGVKWMVSVSLLIAFAGGLGNILTASNIGPWIAYSADSLGDISIIGFAVIMFFLCLMLSILVPSTSGFVAAFFPIFIAITKGFDNPSVAFNLVLIAFILSNGIANLFTPTSAVLMGYTNYALISYKSWLKATYKFIIGLILLSIIVMVISAVVLPANMF